MIRINIVTEGRTEEQFVNRVLFPYLIDKEIIITPRNIEIGTNYQRLKFNVEQWLKEDKTTWVTTMIDLYGLNEEFPGYREHRHQQPYDKVQAIERAFKNEIDRLELDNYRFIPYFQLHEFEAYLFSDTNNLETWLSLDYKFRPGTFQLIRNAFQTPEHINDSILTAPSKRILNIVPSYSKVADGNLIAEDIGIDNIRRECIHFNNWITQLENLS